MIDSKLIEIQTELKEIKTDTANVAQFTPFVESLSKIGTVATLDKLASVLHRINPMTYINGEKQKEIKGVNKVYDMV
jgi:hypothetical protein